MGLADRFKANLENRDIFKSVKSTNESKPVAYTSNPISKSSNYEDLETEIISKIRNTPYWSDFSQEKQLKMIESYFCKKQQNLLYTESQKDEFVQNILILSNNK